MDDTRSCAQPSSSRLLSGGASVSARSACGGRPRMHAPSLDHARRWLDLSADVFDPAAAGPRQGTVGRWWITSLPVARRSAGSCQRSVRPRAWPASPAPAVPPAAPVPDGTGLSDGPSPAARVPAGSTRPPACFPQASSDGKEQHDHHRQNGSRAAPGPRQLRLRRRPPASSSVSASTAASRSATSPAATEARSTWSSATFPAGPNSTGSWPTTSPSLAN